MKLKRSIARLVAPMLLRQLQSDADPLHQMLHDALRLQCGQQAEEDFRLALAAYYQSLDLEKHCHEIEYDRHRRLLIDHKGYKSRIISTRTQHKRSRLWSRRFSILDHMGIHLDIMLLNQGEQVPPHAHTSVVSGFYILEGTVGLRHYNRLNELNRAFTLTKTIDREANSGDFATNSEFHDDVHWLYGIAERSFLYRVHAIHTPNQRLQQPAPLTERIYVDPTGEVNSKGEIIAPFINESDAHALSFYEK